MLLRPTLPGLKGQGLIGQGVSQQGAHRRGRAATPRSTTWSPRWHAPRTPPDAASAPTTAPDPSQIRIEADQRLNAVIVRDIAERLPRYEQLIASLDVEPQSLEIEATIIDVNTDKARELGINWRWSNDGRDASFSGCGAHRSAPAASPRWCSARSASSSPASARCRPKARRASSPARRW